MAWRCLCWAKGGTSITCARSSSMAPTRLLSAFSALKITSSHCVGLNSAPLALQLTECVQRVAQNFAQQHQANRRTAKDLTGYTLLLATRSWKFEVFTKMQRQDLARIFPYANAINLIADCTYIFWNEGLFNWFGTVDCDGIRDRLNRASS